MDNKKGINIRKYWDLQEIVKAKTSSTLYFFWEKNWEKIYMKLIVGYDKKEKFYYTIWEKNSHKTNKQDFIEYISKKIKELGFKSYDKKEKIVNEKLDLDLKVNNEDKYLIYENGEYFDTVSYKKVLELLRSEGKDESYIYDINSITINNMILAIKEKKIH